jgi:hypothetical protein
VLAPRKWFKSALEPTRHHLLSGKHLLLQVFPHLGGHEEVICCPLPWLELLPIRIKRLVEMVVWWLEGSCRKRRVLGIELGSRPGEGSIVTCVQVKLAGGRQCCAHGAHGSERVGIQPVFLDNAIS